MRRMNAAEQEKYKKQEEEFRKSLLIDAATELEDLRKTAHSFYTEAMRKVSIQGKVIVAERKRDDRRNFLYLEMREQKEKGEKGLTEAAIAASISNDKLFQSLDRDVDVLKLAEVRQSHKMEAVRLKHAALKTLTESSRTEMLLSGGVN